MSRAERWSSLPRRSAIWAISRTARWTACATPTVIACEDTRVTAKLLSAYGIHTPMLAYHEHNAARVRPQLIERLKQGQIVALVSDAGTPLVSDPGYKLVEALIAEGMPVTAAPGASALLTALVLSGLPSDRFLFAGFLPPKGAARRTEIRTLAAVPATLIFYEGPQRIGQAAGRSAGGSRPRPAAAVARELTKRFEDVRRGPLAELAAHYADAPQPKGELVVLVGAPELGAAGTATDAGFGCGADRGDGDAVDERGGGSGGGGDRRAAPRHLCARLEASRPMTLRGAGEAV